jgi:hypothetical protein
MAKDLKALEPGTVLRHKSGDHIVLKERKDDDSGWWNTDGSGLADFAFDDEWEVVPDVEIRYLELRGRPPIEQLRRWADYLLDLHREVQDPELSGKLLAVALGVDVAASLLLPERR